MLKLTTATCQENSFFMGALKAIFKIQRAGPTLFNH
jgi:hypothetical protein